MANHYYGVNIGAGADPAGVATGTVTTGKNVELVVVDGVSGNSKAELLKALEEIKNKIIQNGAPA